MITPISIFWKSKRSGRLQRLEDQVTLDFYAALERYSFARCWYAIGEGHFLIHSELDVEDLRVALDAVIGGLSGVSLGVEIFDDEGFVYPESGLDAGGMEFLHDTFELLASQANA